MGQSFFRMKDWRKASFEVNHAVITQILGLFIGDALQSLLGLHDCYRVGEALQILGEAPLVRAAMEPLRQCFWIRGRKFSVSCVSR